MWMSIMILCANMNATSCMVITGNELHTSKEKCFEDSIAKANKVGKAHITALPTNTATSAEASTMPSSYMAAKLKRGAVKLKKRKK
mgnify:CR=1 FL=1